MNKTAQISIVNITLYNFLARITFFLFIFFAGIYASRILTKEEFGTVQYVNWIVTFCWLVFNFGAPATINRFFSHAVYKGHKRSKKILLQFSVMMLFICISASTAAYILYNYYDHQQVNVLVLVYIVSQLLSNYLQILTQATFQYNRLFFITMISSISGAVILFFLLPVYAVNGYILSIISVNVLMIIGYLASLVSLRRNYPAAGNSSESPVSVEVLIRTSLYFAISSVLSSILWQRTELYFIKQHLDLSQLSTYGIALTLIALATEPLRILPGALLSYFSGIKDDREKVQDLFYVFMRYFVWIVVFICLFVATNSASLICCLYTDKYIESAGYVTILMLGFIPGVSSYVVMNMHVGLGRARFLMIQDAIAATLFLSGCIIFIPQYGLLAAVWVKSISLIFTVTVGLIYTHFKLKIIVPVKYMLGSLALAAVLIIPSKLLVAPSLLLLFLKGSALFIVYIAMSFLTGIIEMHTVRKVLIKMRAVFYKKNISIPG